MSSTPDTRLIWIDLEMTGLDTDNDQIIEVATIVTDDHLNILAEGPVLAIHQSPIKLNAMDEWNTRQHGNSGLTARVLASDIDAAEAERQTILFLEQWVEKRCITDVWQQHLSGSSFFMARHAATGSIFSLS